MKWYKSDYHNHSYLSVCAKDEMTVEAMAKEFEKNSLESAGISDHIYKDGKTLDRYKKTKEALSNIKSDVKIYIGCEVDMISPGKLIVDKAELVMFDFIMIACTHYHLKSHMLPPLNFNYNSIAQNTYDYMICVSQMEFADIIVHPFDIRGIKSYRQGFEISKVIEIITDDDFKIIAEKMRESNIAVEINSNVLEKEYANAVFRFHMMCKKEGVKFSLGSDAHWLNGMCDIKKAGEYIEKLNLKEEDFYLM